MKRIATFILCCLAWLAHAQVGVLDRNERKFFVQDEKMGSLNSTIEVAANGDTVLVSEYEDINTNNQGRIKIFKKYKGTPFLRNGWYIGNLHYTGYKSTRGNMAFNLMNGVVYFAVDKKTPAIEAKPDAFDIEGIYLTKLDSTLRGAAHGYYQLIHNAQPRIYKKYFCEYRPKLQVQATGYDINGRDDYEGEFVKSAQYYILQNRRLTPINGTKKSRKVLEEAQPVLAKIAQEQKLNLREQKEVEKLLSYLK